MPTPRDDADLLTAWSARRDEAAFRELCARHIALVAATCRRLGSPDADEAAQAIFLVLSRRANVVEARSLGSWLTGTARRVVADQRRAFASRRKHEQEAAVEQVRQQSASLAEPAWEEARGHLDEALASLSVGRREAVVRFYLEGRPQAEVAAQLGCSTDAVKVRVSEGLERLRAFFARRGVILGAAALASGLASEATAAEPALAATCAQTAFASTTAPGVAALATGTSAVGIGKLLALAGTATLLAVSGGIIAWRALATPSSPPLPPLAVPSPAPAPTRTASVLLAEDFESDDVQARGWYDNPHGFIRSAVEHASGSAHAAEFRFLRGSESPLVADPSRRLFPAADAIRIVYQLKFSPEWTPIARSGYVNQIMVLTDADDPWEAPSHTRLTCAIGFDQGIPFVSLRDTRNLDVGRLGQDLSALTEERAIAGGNGDSDGYGAGEWFQRQDGSYWNEKRCLAERVVLTDQPGPYFTGRWHRIEVRLRLNRVVDGKAVPDGQVMIRLDDQTVLDRPHVMFRTGQHPGMRFNQIIIGPRSDGAPREQTFWIDDLVVSQDQP